jgi:hypothetical protein
MILTARGAFSEKGLHILQKVNGKGRKKGVSDVSSY